MQPFHWHGTFLKIVANTFDTFLTDALHMRWPKNGHYDDISLWFSLFKLGLVR